MFLATVSHLALAGDILRGGAVGPKKNRADALDAATAAAAARARANAKDALSRTTRAISAVQAMQHAARALAAGQNNLGPDPNHPGQMLPDVPDGLAVGGLDPNPGAGWTGAGLPSQSGTNVTIKQNEQQAVLNWHTFNIGRNTSLHFDQSAGGEQVGQWVAFNKVTDPSGRPSQILGSIHAPGQVYVINQNGIIFGATSQVNVHTLVASSLPINDNLVKSGLLNNPNAEFLLSGLPTGTFSPPAPVNGRYGDVTVQAGAQITAPAHAENVGGRVVLAGPNVTNRGTIATPSGQTILAAGLQVGFDASTDPQLRGLRTYVGAVGDYGGTATNAGIIQAPRGSVTIAGRRVNQHGVIDSSTSVSLNGRVDLLASCNAIRNPNYDPGSQDAARRVPFLYPSADSSGIVDIAPGAVIRIIPESDAVSKVAGSRLALHSEVNIQGVGIYFGAGSTLLAPGARVAISAGVWNLVTSASSPPRQDFVRTRGQVYLDRGAMINVAGSVGAIAGLSQHILKVVLRGAELADSPVQRSGKLARGPELTVDLRKTGVYGGRRWAGTPLADLTGYLGLIERTVGELTVGGGSVSLSAGESVIMQSGAVVDVSGGYLNYEGGFVQTTRLLHAGRLFDVATATPDLVYDGIYTGQFTKSHPRWGVTETFTVPWMTGRHFEQGYVHGGDGGSLSISAPSVALDGDLLGHTIAGPRQREAAPQLSSLSLKLTGEKVLPNGTANIFLDQVSPHAPLVIFREHGRQAPAGGFALDAAGLPVPLRDDRKGLIYLSPGLLAEQGFGSLTVENSDGNILVPEGVTLEAPPAGAISLSGANINVRGSIIAPAGRITLNVYNQSPYDFRANLLAAQLAGVPGPAADPARGSFALAPGSVVSAAGLLIDDRLSSPRPVSQLLGVNVAGSDGSVSVQSTCAGGTVAINTYNAFLSEGSVLDVSGGVWMSALGRRTYGNGGSLSIKAGQDLSWKGVLGGQLRLGSILRGYSGARGGSLSLQAQMIQIGGVAQHPNTLLLDPGFFSRGGFASFTLTGFGMDLGTGALGGESYAPAVSIAPGTRIEPVVESLLAIPNVRGSETFGLTTVVKPAGYRTPASLTFRGLTAQDDSVPNTLYARGDLVMGAGSVIRTDPLGSVTFEGTTVDILGSIFAPGGSIRLTGARQLPTKGSSQADVTTVHIGGGARLSTAGTAIYLADRFGRRAGFVLPGGSISVSGNIIADPGAVLDVSGTSAVFDVHPSVLNLNAWLNGELENPPVPVTSGLTTPLYKSLGVSARLDSSGGSITLAGGSFLFTQARLLGHAGGPTALGGTLTVSSGRFGDRDDSAINLAVAQHASSLPFPSLAPGVSPVGRAPVLAGGGAIPLHGYFDVDAFERAGFGALTLGGNVDFRGPVDIAADRYLRVGLGGIIRADSQVTLTAPYVAVGRPFAPPKIPGAYEPVFFSDVPNTGAAIAVLPTYGPGALSIFADHLDIGTLSLRNIGRADFHVARDIRGNGWFDIAGDLRLVAGQIYPTTGSPFTITAYDYKDGGGVTREGGITVGWSGITPEFPLSGGGQLSLYATRITQGGVLRAPLGTINLGWDGTGAAPLELLSRPPGVTVTPDPANPTDRIPVTSTLTLASGSITSVSAIDPATGLGVAIPYGIVKDGSQWIDPAGLDITSTGPPQKAIRLSAANLTTESGSVLDMRGGGELFGYEWVRGNGGSQDILASSGSYTILPGYSAAFSPYGAFGTLTTLDGNPGYVNSAGLLADSATNNTSGVPFGMTVYLAGSPLLPAGYYTLAPARYALFPGAMLVTPLSGDPVGTVQKTDGSYLVGGFMFEDLDGGRRAPGSFQRFELASPATFLQRAEYRLFQASAFFPEQQAKLGVPVTRTPADAGYLLFQAGSSAAIQGAVLARGAPGGRGGVVDINAFGEIVIAGAGASPQPGKLVLDSGLLTTWGAESLLIGGARSSLESTATVSVRASTITVDNAGTPLSAPDIVMAARNLVSVLPGGAITQSGELADAAQVLLFGDPGVAGSGDGALLRVSSDPGARILRRAFSAPSPAGPRLSIGGGALLSGTSLILDSTARSDIDSTATLDADYLTLTSGQISMQMDIGVPVPASPYLVLGRGTLDQLQNAVSLNLTSYSSIDMFGAGAFAAQGLLNLTAGEIRGFANGGGAITITGDAIAINNATGSTRPGAGAVIPGSRIRFNAGNLSIGAGALAIDQFSEVLLNASNGLLMSGAGSLSAQVALTANTPGIFATQSATHALRAGGALNVIPTGGGSTLSSELGAKIVLEGSSTNVGSAIHLPSGVIEATALSGDLVIGGALSVDGAARTFFDEVRYTDAGQIALASATGSVTLLPGSSVSVSANPAAGDAGSLTIRAPQGVFTSGGSITGSGGAGGQSGSFALDAASLPGFAALNSVLNNGAFTNARSLRVRTGNIVISDTVSARDFSLSADQGSILVTGVINASGTTGGMINLVANGSVTLAPGAVLNVRGAGFSNAGKGGSVSLEAGSSFNGSPNLAAVLDIQGGSVIDLGVDLNNTAPEFTQLHGRYTGTLHLRAPQVAGGNEVTQIQAINGTIIDASHIAVEGYRVYAPAGGIIQNSGTLNANGTFTPLASSLLGQIVADGNTFGGSSAAITSRLLITNPHSAALVPLLVVMPGAEIINTAGSLQLGRNSSSPVIDDWNLATLRFGPRNAPGVLTMRAAGDLIFYNALSDGFDVTQAASTGPNTTSAVNQVERLWTAPLLAQDISANAPPVNAQSWTFRLAAGADMTAADFREVLAPDPVNGGAGSVLIGKNAGQAIPQSVSPGNTSPGLNAVTRLAINPANATNATTASNRFQVVRTGSGDIHVSARGDVQFLNQFATIYTAGVQVRRDGGGNSMIFNAGDFSDPVLFGLNFPDYATNGGNPTGSLLGAGQQRFAAQYSRAGGNVVVQARRDIIHLTRDALNNVIADSSRQLPNNWLYRRDVVDANGNFAPVTVTNNLGAVFLSDPSASLTWWVDFSNFFDGVGALGGGDVTLVAGRDVANVSAHAPTNARATSGSVAASRFLELGGGDVLVQAGRDIDAGVFYAERGTGTLAAGGSIKTNSTRSPSTGRLTSTNALTDELSWMPTTIFLGKSSFDVNARGDLLLGPMANPFLLPQGINNRYWYKTYFNTFAPDASVSASSLGGSVTLRQEGNTRAANALPILQNWLQMSLASSNTSAGHYQPWIRNAETQATVFGTLATVAAPRLEVNAFSGDINLQGSLNLFPSSQGSLELLAGGSISGVRPLGAGTLSVGGTNPVIWSAASYNLSDANPASLPGVLSPFAFNVANTAISGLTTRSNDLRATLAGQFLAINPFFIESGATNQATQSKQTLHAPFLLHAGDPEPARVYALGGDISGLTLFSGKASRIFAARDITDVSLYLQNVDASDFSIVTGGRDIVPYNPNSVLRTLAQASGNILIPGSKGAAAAGDLQIGGPGTLEVLAGRDLRLGSGTPNADGTGAGIVSIGNARNPYPSFEGASLVLGAGVGLAAVLSGAQEMDFESFISQFVTGADGDKYLAELDTGVTAAEFEALPEEERRKLALDVFFLILRDAGRQQSGTAAGGAGGIAAAAGASGYARGTEAISVLFPNGGSGTGDIFTEARDVRTKNGGSITMLIPSGSLVLQQTAVTGAGSLVPPGVVTEHGGGINIFAHESVRLGISRIFTLRGGDITIWASTGDINAGSSAKTVQSAPPTRVIIDPTSADVQTDLSGLATGGGIGVLATVAGVPPGNVDLIAPLGTVDAGDAGIRATGNLNIAATAVLNASNIAVGGASAGTPSAPAVAAPNIGGLASASSTAGASTSAASAAAQQAAPAAAQRTMADETPSIITVEVLGYGGGSGFDDEEEEKRRRARGTGL